METKNYLQGDSLKHDYNHRKEASKHLTYNAK